MRYTRLGTKGVKVALRQNGPFATNHIVNVLDRPRNNQSIDRAVTSLDTRARSSSERSSNAQNSGQDHQQTSHRVGLEELQQQQQHKGWKEDDEGIKRRSKQEGKQRRVIAAYSSSRLNILSTLGNAWQRLTPMIALFSIYSLSLIHNTTQHNTTQHNTTQHNTTQHGFGTLIISQSIG
jgi:hypothetical protein